MPDTGSTTVDQLDLKKLKALYVTGGMTGNSNMTVYLHPKAGPTATQRRQVEAYLKRHDATQGAVWDMSGEVYKIVITMNHGATTKDRRELIAKFAPKYRGGAKMRVVIGRGADHVVDITFCAFDLEYHSDHDAIDTASIAGTAGIAGRAELKGTSDTRYISFALAVATKNEAEIREILRRAAKNAGLYLTNDDADMASITRDEGGIYTIHAGFDSAHDRQAAGVISAATANSVAEID